MKKEKQSVLDGTQEISEVSEVDENRLKYKKHEKWASVNRAMDRIFGFILVTVLVIGSGLLAFDYLCVKGPSPTFRNTVLRTFSETRRFDFINNLFLTDDELEDIGIIYDMFEEQIMAPTMDTSLITIAEEKTDDSGRDAYGLVDDDGDGIILQTVTYHGATGYLIVILDPTRVMLGTAQDYGSQYGGGIVLDDMVAKYGARGGINAGVFMDDGGGGSGWPPQGITIMDYNVFEDSAYGPVAGLDENGILYVGDFSITDCQNLGLKYACTFGPVLIVNGEKMDEESLSSGVNPRTAIGQRADGAILMLAVDGRQAYSFGLTYGDCADLLLEYGCINAMNMDGGSSTCMYMDGALVNHPSNQAGGTRYLPTAWLFK